jgi:hypothetical protein
MIWESLADFVATGYENARAIEIASHNWEADTFAGTDTSAVGVGSMCITEDGVICIVTSSENPGTRVDEDGEPDTYLHLIYGVLEPHAHGPSLGTWSSDTVNQLPPEDRFWRTRGLVTAGGTRTVWNSGEAQMARQLRVSVVKSADGIYDYSFIDHTNTPVTLETDRYRVDVQVDGNNGFARIQNRAMSGFTVLTKNDAGVLTNTQHTFEVTVPKVWCGVY